MDAQNITAQSFEFSESNVKSREPQELLEASQTLENLSNRKMFSIWSNVYLDKTEILQQ